MFGTENNPTSKQFVMENKNTVQNLMELIGELLQKAVSCRERKRLQDSLQLLRACANIRPHECVANLLQGELHDQLAWAATYCRYQSQVDTYTALVDNGLISERPGRDYWLFEFAKEVFEGAKAICMILDQSLEIPGLADTGGWVTVNRKSPKPHFPESDEDQLSASGLDDSRRENFEGGGEEAEDWRPKPSDGQEVGGQDVLDIGPRQDYFWYF